MGKSLYGHDYADTHLVESLCRPSVEDGLKEPIWSDRRLEFWDFRLIFIDLYCPHVYSTRLKSKSLFVRDWW